MDKIHFKDFLLNESKFFLAERLGDLLSALQDLIQNVDGMGLRQLSANSERIVNQMRRILHSNWSKKEEKYLKNLQKAAVALAKAIEDKQNLPDVLPAIVGELEGVLAKMGQPVNSMAGTEEAEPPEAETGVSPSEGKAAPDPNKQPKQDAPPAPEQQPPQNQM